MTKKKKSVDVQSFLALSSELTGYEALDKELAEEYYDRIKKEFGAERLSEVLEAFKDGGGLSRVFTPKDDKAAEKERAKRTWLVAKEIIILWYMSQFGIPKRGEFDEAGNQKYAELPPETAEQYFRGLFWPTIRAHPLGLSGGYFGYWRYPPEN